MLSNYQDGTMSTTTKDESNTSEGSSFTQKHKGKKCYLCSKFGHIAKDCPEKDKQKKGRQFMQATEDGDDNSDGSGDESGSDAPSAQPFII